LYLYNLYDQINSSKPNDYIHLKNLEKIMRGVHFGLIALRASSTFVCRAFLS